MFHLPATKIELTDEDLVDADRRREQRRSSRTTGKKPAWSVTVLEQTLPPLHPSPRRDREASTTDSLVSDEPVPVTSGAFWSKLAHEAASTPLQEIGDCPFDSQGQAQGEFIRPCPEQQVGLFQNTSRVTRGGHSFSNNLVHRKAKANDDDGQPQRAFGAPSKSDYEGGIEPSADVLYMQLRRRLSDHLTLDGVSEQERRSRNTAELNAILDEIVLDQRRAREQRMTENPSARSSRSRPAAALQEVRAERQGPSDPPARPRSGWFSPPRRFGPDSLQRGREALQPLHSTSGFQISLGEEIGGPVAADSDPEPRDDSTEDDSSSVIYQDAEDWSSDHSSLTLPVARVSGSDPDATVSESPSPVQDLSSEPEVADNSVQDLSSEPEVADSPVQDLSSEPEVAGVSEHSDNHSARSDSPEQVSMEGNRIRHHLFASSSSGTLADEESVSNTPHAPPTTPRRGLPVYNDNLPAAGQPQTPADRRIRGFNPAYTAPAGSMASAAGHVTRGFLRATRRLLSRGQAGAFDEEAENRMLAFERSRAGRRQPQQPPRTSRFAEMFDEHRDGDEG